MGLSRSFCHRDFLEMTEFQADAPDAWTPSRLGVEPWRFLLPGSGATNLLGRIELGPSDVRPSCTFDVRCTTGRRPTVLRENSSISLRQVEHRARRKPCVWMPQAM